MLKRSLLTLAALTLTSGALAQNPQPATLTIDPAQTPEVLQVLDNQGHWAPLGSVDPAAHQFHVNNGETDILVTDPSVGMMSGGQDNVPFIANLMNKMGPPVYGLPGYDVTFPSVPGQRYTEYYFSKSLVLSRGARYHCSGAAGSPTTILVFAPGDHGVVQEDRHYTSDGGSGGGAI